MQISDSERKTIGRKISEIEQKVDSFGNNIQNIITIHYMSGREKASKNVMYYLHHKMDMLI